METNKLIRWLLGIIGLLVVLNLALIGWMIFGPLRGRPPMGGPMALQFLERELTLTDKQREQVIALREQLSDKSRPLDDSVRQLRKQLFLIAKEPDEADSTASALAGQIARLVSRLEKNRFDHFRAIRRLCDPQQQERLDNIMQEIAERQGPPPGGGRPGELGRPMGEGPPDGPPPPGQPE